MSDPKRPNGDGEVGLKSAQGLSLLGALHAVTVTGGLISETGKYWLRIPNY